MEIKHEEGKVIISDESVKIEIKNNEGFSATQEGDLTKVDCGNIVYEKIGDNFNLSNRVERKTVLGDKGPEIVHPIYNMQKAYEEVLGVKFQTIPPLPIGGTIKYHPNDKLKNEEFEYVDCTHGELEEFVKKNKNMLDVLECKIEYGAEIKVVDYKIKFITGFAIKTPYQTIKKEAQKVEESYFLVRIGKYLTVCDFDQLSLLKEVFRKRQSNSRTQTQELTNQFSNEEKNIIGEAIAIAFNESFYKTNKPHGECVALATDILKKIGFDNKIIAGIINGEFK